MSAVITALTGGQPARFGEARVLVARRRCHRSKVPGVTRRRTAASPQPPTPPTAARPSRRPRRPDHPIADLSRQRIRRQPVLGGLIYEYGRDA